MAKIDILTVQIDPRTKKIQLIFDDFLLFDQDKENIISEIIIKSSADMGEIEGFYSAKLMDSPTLLKRKKQR